MEIADLSPAEFDAFDAFHPNLPERLSAMAIGWLGSTVPSRGSWSVDEHAALEHLTIHHYVDSCDLGYHGCEVCDAVMGRAEFLLTWDGRAYLAPALVLHYVDDHSYRPPEQFMVDLMSWWRSASAECHQGRCSRGRTPSIHPYTAVEPPPSFLQTLVRRLPWRR